MSKFIKSILWFTPFSLAIYLLLLVLWGELTPPLLKKNLNYKKGSYGHLYSRIQELKKTHDVDILFLGSSHTYRGFDPRVFARHGFHTFNLGSSSQSPIQTEILLKRYLDKLNPSMIIYEVCPSTFSTDGIESALDIIANDTTDRLVFDMALELNHVKVYNTLIYALYRDFFNRDKGFVEAIIKEEDTYITGGYVEREMAFFRHIPQDSSPWSLNQAQMQAFDRIINQLNELQIPFVLVQSPITHSKYRSYPDNAVFDEKMETYGQYHNFNELMAVEDSLHFYDEQHLNQQGVELFNVKLIEVLQLSGQR